MHRLNSMYPASTFLPVGVRMCACRKTMNNTRAGYCCILSSALPDRQPLKQGPHALERSLRSLPARTGYTAPMTLPLRDRRRGSCKVGTRSEECSTDASGSLGFIQ